MIGTTLKRVAGANTIVRALVATTINEVATTTKGKAGSMTGVEENGAPAEVGEAARIEDTPGADKGTAGGARGDNTEQTLQSLITVSAPVRMENRCVYVFVDAGMLGFLTHLRRERLTLPMLQFELRAISNAQDAQTN